MRTRLRFIFRPQAWLPADRSPVRGFFAVPGTAGKTGLISISPFSHAFCGVRGGYARVPCPEPSFARPTVCRCGSDCQHYRRPRPGHNVRISSRVMERSAKDAGRLHARFMRRLGLHSRQTGVGCPGVLAVSADCPGQCWDGEDPPWATCGGKPGPGAGK